MEGAVTRVLVAVADKPLRDSLTEMIKGLRPAGGGKLTCESAPPRKRRCAWPRSRLWMWR